MTIKPPQRMTGITAHFFAGLSARIQQLTAEGRDVIRLDEGAPDLPPAPHIIEALAASARRPDAHSYQPQRGPAGLRPAWAERYLQDYGVRLDPETEITPLLGSKEGIFHAALAWVGPGDVVLVPDPGYITYTRGTQMSGGELCPLPLHAEHGYMPDLTAIPENVLRRTRLMWLNYPNNPTAAVATYEFFTGAVALAQKYGFLLAHDGAYLKIAFDGEQPHSLLEIPGAKEVAVEFNTLSKSHNMAGWRSGAALGNAQAIKLLYTLKTNADSGHFRPIWDASIVALTGDQDWLQERNQVYQRRRDAVVAGLEKIGIPVNQPRASLYVWAPVPAGWDCEAFTTAVLEGAGVSFTPGTVFGSGGAGHMRISITAPEERIVEAMTRLEEWK